MRTIELMNIARRFGRDRRARLALAHVSGTNRRNRETYAAHDRAERLDAAAKLLFVGAAAGLYVMARIGLTYAVLGH
jgi:hypothetical protein